MSLPIIDIVTENPTEQDCAAIIAPLRQFNRANRGMIEDRPDFAVLVRDPDTREVLGGLYGTDSYGWAFVKYLVVPEQFRGQKLGSHLIEEAEKIARDRGYIGIWLDTFEFQAKPFYEKMGYTVFGELEGAPNAIGRYFLKKKF